MKVFVSGSVCVMRSQHSSSVVEALGSSPVLYPNPPRFAICRDGVSSFHVPRKYRLIGIVVCRGSFRDQRHLRYRA